MKWIASLCLIALLAGCGDDDHTKNPVPTDGVADLNFRNRPYQFEFIQLISHSVKVAGILDQKDQLNLILENLNMEKLGKYDVTNNNCSGFLVDYDAIYGEYDVIENDAFEDFLSLDSITDKQLYYSLQLNVVDSAFNEVPDTLWISGTMRVNRP